MRCSQHTKGPRINHRERAAADCEPPAYLDGPALSAWVQQLKLCIHAREWTASKLRPRVYGERLDVSVQHTQISVLAALEMAEQRVEHYRSE
jgi:hypothetical protein